MTAQNTVFSPGTSRLWKEVEEDHEDLDERLRKTLYYGKLPGTDRPSLPLTDLAVHFFQEAAPRELGKIDSYLAASSSRSACMSATSMTVGMMYVQRLHRRRPDYLSQISSSELFLISMMMASKFIYDEGIDDEVYNDEWALSGDLETEDVNELEMEFLRAIDWHLFVRPDDFGEMLQHIEKRIALQEGLKRGWFSYTDMMLLSHDLKFMKWNQLASELSKVILATSLAYVAGILTMVGSTMLGTATSTSLINLGASTVLPIWINLGSTVLPLCLKLSSPLMTLYPELSLKVIQGSRPLVDIDFRGLSSEGLDFSNDENQTGAGFPAEEGRGIDQGEKDNQLGQGQPNATFDLDAERTTKNPPQHKDTHRLLNRLLPPFLALMTLKDSVLDYAFGAKQSTQEHDLRFHNHLGNDLDTSSSPPSNDLDNTRNLPHVSEFCSAGPCLLDSWSNCWNVTMTTDNEWTEYKTYESHCCRDSQPCCSKCILNANPNSDHLGVSWTAENQDGRALDFGDSAVKCCCKFSEAEAASWVKGRLDSADIVDLNLRFLTQSLFPVFITT